MRILIAYASKHGATAGIAERIGATLEQRGLDVSVLPISEIPHPLQWDAAVIGSAVYMGRWTKEATSFLRQHQAELVRIPVWLFSSGPVGPQVLPEAADLQEFRTLLNSKGDATFDGALDAKTLSLPERMMVKAVRAPYGDYRKWERIDEWAGSIVTSLGSTAAQERVQKAGSLMTFGPGTQPR